MHKLVFVNMVLVAMAGALAFALSAATPPVAARRDHLQTWHGQKVNDPYHWIREKDSPDVLRYLEAENAYTDAVTQDLKPLTETLYEEMLSHVQQTDLSVPTRQGRFFYYNRTVEGQQYPIRCRKAAGPNGAWDELAKEEVLLDQNQMAQGLKFLSVAAFSVSDDDAQLLYSTDTTGFRQFKLFVKNLATGKTDGPLAERVTSLTWAADNETVLYVTEDPVTKRPDTLWRQKTGGIPEKLFEEKDPSFRIGVWRTKDKKYVVLTSEATDTWESQVLDAHEPKGGFRVVLPRVKGHKYDLEHRGGLFYIRTNQDAKNFRIVTVPVADPSSKNWKPFIEHRNDVLLQRFEPFRDFAVVQEKAAGLVRLRVLSFASGEWRDITFQEPTYSASSEATPEFDTRLFRYSYQSFITPTGVYDFDMGSGTTTLLKRQPVPGYDAQAYASERVWVTARDGVKVPLSVVYRRDFKRDGKAPLLLYAYGSYGYGSSATFNSNRLSLLDRGVVFALAHIRGGDEMGEAWHDDGMLMKKKNTFFDFIDCAEYLIAQKWTSKDRIIIEGGSAGGC